MSDLAHTGPGHEAHSGDQAPGDQAGHGFSFGEGIGAYVFGFGFAALLTAVSFFVANTSLVWQPSIPVALAVLAVGQMGVHLVFFLHITGGPDGLNNIMALAFGTLIVLLLVGGSLWVMGNMNGHMGNMSM